MDDESTYGRFLPFLMQALGTGAKAANPYLALGTLGLGAVQTIGSLINLRKLRSEPRPQYTVSPELRKSYDTALYESGFGYSPTETSAFQQQQAQLQQADFLNKARMAGGGMAQALSGQGLGQLLSSSNRFAAESAGLRRQKLGQLYGLSSQIQGVGERQTGLESQYRMKSELGASSGLASGLTNIASGVNSAMLGGFKNPFASLGKNKKPQYPSGGPSIDNMPPFGPIGGGGYG